MERHLFYLDKEQALELLWPPICVVCESQDPDSTVAIKSGWLARKRLNDSVFESTGLEVPVCLGCSGSARRSRVYAGLTTVLSGVIATAFFAAGFVALCFSLPPDLGLEWPLIALLVLSAIVGYCVSTRLYVPYVVYNPDLGEAEVVVRSKRVAEALAELNSLPLR